MLRKGLGLALVLLLASCRTVPPAHVLTPPPAAQSWETRRSQLQSQDRFELKGRVAVSTGGEGFNARLRWTQQGRQTRMSLDGPLGAGGVQVNAQGPELSIVDSHGQRLENEAARSELATRLGFDPPLQSLRYWILGVPDPAQPAQESLDDRQRLATLQQAGWSIDYGDYVTVGGEWRPSRLTLVRQGVRVRVFVDGWNS